MATAGQVLKSALQRILVQASEAPLEASEFQDAINDMNNYMLDLDASGIRLGYTLVTSLGDEVTVPLGALRGVIANVAIEIAPDYDGQISPALLRAADQGMKTMEKLGVTVRPTAHPSTLPIGSGNEDGSSGSFHFYPGPNEDEILSETTGAILLESDTEETV